MIMSNFISESERHAELYGTFTNKQLIALELVKKNVMRKNDRELMQYLFLENNVSDEEVHWLERTGRLMPIA